MAFIEIKNLCFDYVARDENDEIIDVNHVLNDVSLDIGEGEFIAVLGKNGSGKSTLARCLNGINQPASGDVIVDGMNTKDEDRLLDIRKKVGMVFQNPDNQIIANVVEEDVAFGLENIGVPTPQIWERVNEALEQVGMESFRDKSPNRLSGGQKQRVAIAGVMAMRPKCIVLDEATAMLDPIGRKEIMSTAMRLKDEGMTVVHITHYMEEVLNADKVIVIEGGRIVMQGTPGEIFAKADDVKRYGLDVPKVTELALKLGLREGIISTEELIEELREDKKFNK